MKAKANRVAMMSDCRTPCRPSEGHVATPFDIETDDYEEIGQGQLPPSDEQFPRGVPDVDLAEVNGKILRKKKARLSRS